MPTKSLSELQEMVGKSRVTVEDFKIEDGKVAEFAHAIKDEDEVYQDAEVAAERGFDSIPAPLTFTRVAYFPRYRPDDVDDIRPFDLGFQLERIVHGEQEYEFERPVQVGDILTGEITLSDVYQREGSRGGVMTFAVFDLEYRNQDGELILTARQTYIETAAEDSNE